MRAIRSGRPLSRRLVVLAGATTLSAALFAPIGAHADTPTSSVAPDASEEDTGVPVTTGISVSVATTLTDGLGASRSAGTYLGDDGRMVVNVTDVAAAFTVQTAGGVPRVVEYATDHLESIVEELNETIGTPGTAWGIDVVNNQVTVEVDATVSDAEITDIERVVAGYGDAVRIGELAGTFSDIEIPMRGGQDITSDASSCTLGFNVRKRSDPKAKYFITAGHCLRHSNAKKWDKTTGGSYLGYRAGYSWGNNGHDFGLVRYDNSDFHPYGVVWRGNGATQDISIARNPVVGERVSRRGATSGNGEKKKVLATDVTVNLDSGVTLTGLIMTGHCSRPGDSGGPLYTGQAALGIASLANDPADPGACRTYYQPIVPALNAYKVEVY